MYEAIRKILAEQLLCDVDTITLESNLRKDLNADSLDIVEIIQIIEETYNIKVIDNDIVKLKTVKDIVDYIENKI